MGRSMGSNGELGSMKRYRFLFLSVAVVAVFCTLLPMLPVFAQRKLPSRSQAVLQALELISGRGYFRDNLEIAVSEQKNSVSVLFRKPLSTIIITPGRFRTKDLLKVTWIGERPIVTVLDKPQGQDAFDSKFTKSLDEIRAKVVLAALTDMYKRQKVNVDKEFEVYIGWNAGCYQIELTHIPRVPDNTGYVYVNKDFKVVDR